MFIEMSFLAWFLLAVSCFCLGFGLYWIYRFDKTLFLVVTIGIITILSSVIIEYDAEKGKPVSLSVLIVGKKYELMAVCEGGYMILKSTEKEGSERELRFVGPVNNLELNISSIGGIYIKTAKNSLEELK